MEKLGTPENPIRVDESLENADWPKRTDDTLGALMKQAADKKDEKIDDAQHSDILVTSDVDIIELGKATTQYFIVRHDLESFRAMPGFIWKTGYPEQTTPKGFGTVSEGDRWIEFAYVDEGNQKKKRCSMVTGFYECTKTHWYGRIPLGEGTLDDGSWEPGAAERIKKCYQGQGAHMIQGRRCEEEGYPCRPVAVPSIYQMLGRHIQPYATVARIGEADFEIIRKETCLRELSPCRIPLLEREPLNEQELLSVVVWGHKQLGIEKIIKVQCRFPDMLVRIGGEEVHFELEVDSLGFQEHIDKNQLRPVPEGEKLAARVKDENDQRPVAVLCWVDGDLKHTLKEQVPDLQIFEVQALLRGEKKIPWQPHGNRGAAGHLGE